MAAPIPTEYACADTEAVRTLPRPEEEPTGPLTAPAERLVCVAGADLGKTFALDAVATVVGRMPGGGGIELRATDVSRRHARLSRSRGNMILEDLGSSNGTFVNDVAVQTPVTLQVGDRLRFGTSTFVFTRHDELEARLRQLEKLEAMSALVKGLAHDFNNMLMVLQAGLEVLGDRTTDAEDKETLQDMKQATSSAAGLVRRLLQVGRSKPSTIEQVHVQGLLANVVTMSGRLTNDRVRVAVQAAPAAMVRGSREELEQVFLNLILNARDAMPNGGHVLIKAAVTTLDRAEALGLHLETEGSYVDISVIDTGSGMDPATLARIFEPFFTTKAVGKGSGLGLAMVYNSMRNHGGSVFAESTVGRGTTFRLLLPSAG